MGKLSRCYLYNQIGKEMRQLANFEVTDVAGGANLGPTLSDVLSFAAQKAVPVMVGSAAGLVLRNVIGWDNLSANEIMGSSLLSGVAFVAAFTGTVAYQDPEILTR